MRTGKLTGRALDWAVAKCEDEQIADAMAESESIFYGYGYSTDWAEAGPIIEREAITITPIGKRTFAECHGIMRSGPTMLVAAMRSYVAYRLGDFVDVPEPFKQKEN